MLPLVNRPTRVCLVNGLVRYSLLDQIWATVGVGQTRSFVLPMSITDHFPVCTIIESANPLTNSAVKKIETRVFNESNKEIFRAIFSSLQLILTFDNFNLGFSHFYKMMFFSV